MLANSKYAPTIVQQKMSVSTVLPFQINFEKKNLRTTSYKTTVTTTVNAVQTTETKKKEVPLIAAGASLHNVLHCINEFYNAKKILNWTTGNKLFQNIEDIFEDPQDQTFWEITLSTNPSRSVAQFDVFIKEYIANKFSNDTKAYRTHRRFLNAIKKTKTLSVHQFVSLVQYHNGNILPLLPGAPATEASYSPDDLKDIIFNSMPEEWRDGFDLLIDIDDATLPILVKYMEKRNSQANKKKSGNQSNGNQNRKETEQSEGKNNNDRNDRKKNGKGKGQNNNRKQGNNSQQTGRIKDSDPCPLPGHGGHTWGSCFQNINNPNANRRNSSGGNNRNNGGNNNRDNHVNEGNSNNNERNNQGNDNSRSNQRNPQQGDNYYCTFTNNSPTDIDFTDLFHVDCKIDEDYYSEDLQRFPTTENETIEFEETFATNEETREDTLQSPPPPEDATGFIRLSKPTEAEDLAPTTVVVCNQVNDGIKLKLYLKTLFDSGSTDNIVTKTSLPKGTELLLLKSPITMRTAQGTYECKNYCYLNYRG